MCFRASCVAWILVISGRTTLDLMSFYSLAPGVERGDTTHSDQWQLDASPVRTRIMVNRGACACTAIERQLQFKVLEFVRSRPLEAAPMKFCVTAALKVCYTLESGNWALVGSQIKNTPCRN